MGAGAFQQILYLIAETDEIHYDRWHFRRCKEEVLSDRMMRRRGHAAATRTAGTAVTARPSVHKKRICVLRIIPFFIFSLLRDFRFPIGVYNSQPSNFKCM